jgi:vitamin B12 transporter
MHVFCRYLFIVGVLAGLSNAAAGPALALEDDGRIVITAEEISGMKAVRIADVLNQVPGLKAGDTSVAIHGNYKVKVLVDGRPINDPTAVLSGVKWDLVSLENVEKIEILRGKGGLEYGDDASGGVILITTMKIRRFSGNVKAYGGNYNTRSTGANWRISKGALGGALSAAFDTTEGYKVNNDKEKWRAGGKIEYAPHDAVDLTVSADHLEEEQGYSGTRDYPTPYSRVESRMNSFSLLARAGSIDAKTYYNEGRKHNTDVSKGLDQTLRVKNVGQDLSTAFSFGSSGKLRCGAAFQWGEADGTTIQDQEETVLSVFGAHSIKIKKLPLTLTAGLRANFYSVFGDSINPEVKACWQKERWNLTLAYSRSNNTPSFHQRYNQTSSTRPNPDLKMETADNYSLSVFTQIGPSLSASSTFFFNALRDRITYVREDDGTGQYMNFGEVTYKGGDLAISWQINSHLTFKTSYTYLEARDETTGLWLTAKSRHKADAEIFYRPMERLSLVAGVDYASKVYTRADNSRSVPDYTIVNLRGEYSFRRFGLFGEIKNLADITYYYADETLAPPRTWLVGVNWHF